jgi:lipopolysaccharide/colanic/teichoic acid biosynthesis glycosyltransferase
MTLDPTRPLFEMTATTTSPQPRIVPTGPDQASSMPVVDPSPPRPAPKDLRIQLPLSRALKRALDIAAAIPLCVAFAVAYPFVAIALKATSRGPVLFRQVRVGRDGHPATVYKFRSMVVDAEGRLEADPELYRQYVENGFKIPAAVDPRITKVGRVLRRTSLDELPQALCLLLGTMTLVGPRPVLPDELAVLYGDAAPYYLACKPGLTGLWQVSGRSTVTDRERADLDVAYASEWTLVGDVRILLRTVPVVLSAHGAH